MENLKNKIMQEIIRLGKAHRRLWMPALFLAALFLAAYHGVRNFFLEFRYHPVRQRIISGMLVLSLVAGQIGIINAFAEADAGQTEEPAAISQDQQVSETLPDGENSDLNDGITGETDGNEQENVEQDNTKNDNTVEVADTEGTNEENAGGEKQEEQDGQVEEPAVEDANEENAGEEKQEEQDAQDAQAEEPAVEDANEENAGGEKQEEQDGQAEETATENAIVTENEGAADTEDADEENAGEEKQEKQDGQADKPAVGDAILAENEDTADVEDVESSKEEIALLGYEEDNSYLYVNGIAVTQDNASDIFGNGTASYDEVTHTLTLNGVTINTGYEITPFYAGIYARGDINIVLKGANSINVSNSGKNAKLAGICANGKITIGGSGSLNVIANGTNYLEVMGISTGSTPNEAGIIINSGTITVKSHSSAGNSYAVYLDESYDVALPSRYFQINGGTVELDATSPANNRATSTKPDLSRYDGYSATAVYQEMENPEAYDENAWDCYRYIKIQPLVYDDNGISDDKKHYQPAKQAGDGYYEIGNAGNLYWFAEKLRESESNATLNARLVSNITMPDDMNWVAMKVGNGYYGTDYNGTFDGCGHTISNLSTGRVMGVFDNEGLFTTIGSNGIVKNLGMININVKQESSGAGAICGTNCGRIENCYNLGGNISASYGFAGGIAGDNEGVITHCYNTGTVVSGSGSYVGGIAGSLTDGEISDCYNTGKITGAWGVGGICGNRESGIIKACYNTGSTTAVSSGLGYTANPIVGYPSGDNDISNSYYLAEAADKDGGRTEEQFASGEVAWLLNEGSEGGSQAFYQTCGEGYPVFTGQTVYDVKSYRCPGDKNGKTVYSNTNQNITGEHDFAAETVEHIYLKSVATCTELAKYYKSCTICGKADTVETFSYGDKDLTNHAKLVKTEKKAPTHMVKGNREYWHCENCDKYFGDEACLIEIALADTPIEKLPEHTAGIEWKSDAECHYHVCECGEIMNKAVHNFGEWITDKEATENNTGTKHRICQICSYEEKGIIPTLGHKEVKDKAEAATCTKTGLTEGSHCAGCNDVLTEQKVTDALGHDYSGNYQYNGNAHWKVCSRCGEKGENTIHRYDDDSDAVCNVCSYERKTQTENETSQTENETSQTKNETSQTENETSQTVPATVENDRIVISGELDETGNLTENSKTATILEVGEGAVTVTVVCEDEKYATGVEDTVAVANAVLTKDQIQLVNDGESINIRIDVKDISETVERQDKEVIESGLTQYREEMPGLTLGSYFDISMFIRIGEGDWDAITHTDAPIEVVIGIPDELKEDGREFYIIRSHDGEYTLLRDMDDEPDTITISTDMFSAYAFAYEDAEKEEQGVEKEEEIVEKEEQGAPKKEQDAGEQDEKCGLCHICPTFLGICYFIWLAIIILIVIVGIILLRKKKKK